MDGVLSFVGSYNLDPLSAGVNGEVVTSVWSDEFAARQRALILDITERPSPQVHEYLIEKLPDGRPLLREGKAVVRFGPKDHCSPEQLKKIERLEPVLELLAPLL